MKLSHNFCPAATTAAAGQHNISVLWSGVDMPVVFLPIVVHPAHLVFITLSENLIGQEVSFLLSLVHKKLNIHGFV